jgi:hypothetical protein
MQHDFYYTMIENEDEKKLDFLFAEDSTLFYRPSAIISKFPNEEEFRHVHYDNNVKMFVLRKTQEKENFTHYLLFYIKRKLDRQKPLFYIPFNETDWIKLTDDFEEVFDFVNWDNFEVYSDYMLLNVLEDLPLFAKCPIDKTIKLGTAYYDPKVSIEFKYSFIEGSKLSYEPILEGAEFDEKALVKTFRYVLGK